MELSRGCFGSPALPRHDLADLGGAAGLHPLPHVRQLPALIVGGVGPVSLVGLGALLGERRDLVQALRPLPPLPAPRHQLLEDILQL